MKKQNTDSPMESEDSCPKCNHGGILKILKVRIPNETPTYISSFTCSHCEYSNRQIYDGDIGDGTGVEIDCHFNCQEDLQRTIRIQKLCKVVFSQDGRCFEYACGQTGITIVEAIIRDLIGELGGIFDINTSSESFARFGDKSTLGSSASMNTSKSTSSFLSVCDKSDAKKQIEFLKKMLSDPKFTMVITDESGLSRVSPLNKLVTEMEPLNLEKFNDERVKHKAYVVEVDAMNVEDNASGNEAAPAA